MVRLTASLAVTLLVGAPLCAGELDKEFATRGPATPQEKSAIALVKTAPTQEASAPAKASELDDETPADAIRRGGWGGWHGGWGRGWGSGGWGRGWGWGGYRGWGWGWRGGRWWGAGLRYAYWPAYYYPGYASYAYYGYPGAACW